MKAILKSAAWLVFNLFWMLWGTYRLADGVFTGVELLQTALVLINLYLAVYWSMALMAAWKAYREDT